MMKATASSKFNLKKALIAATALLAVPAIGLSGFVAYTYMNPEHACQMDPAAGFCEQRQLGSIYGPEAQTQASEPTSYTRWTEAQATRDMAQALINGGQTNWVDNNIAWEDRLIDAGFCSGQIQRISKEANRQMRRANGMGDYHVPGPAQSARLLYSHAACH